jgi:2-(1,2-epoxy-1,2-dihydrophenyl)acetyl-CoA isomerase
MSTTIEFSVSNGVATLRLNRPQVYNSFTREMALAMQDYLDQCASDASIRCVVITGVGKGFSAGQDLAEISGPNAPEMRTILGEHYNPIVQRIVHLEKPVVAAVNGVAAGAGANIALACDIVVAAESASFIQAFSKIGLIPDSGGTWTLPRLIGLQRASAVMMLADKVSAPEAERWGMIYKAIPDDQFEAEVLRISSTLAGMPTKGLALTKKALQHSFSHSLTQQLATEESLQIQAGQTHDYKEGVRAFLEKRKPQFNGH